jgi:hypothetical protein
VGGGRGWDRPFFRGREPGVWVWGFYSFFVWNLI